LGQKECGSRLDSPPESATKKLVFDLVVGTQSSSSMGSNVDSCSKTVSRDRPRISRLTVLDSEEAGEELERERRRRR